jgi:pimeloyl-ACP methyl ester carboxylesterase
MSYLDVPGARLYYEIHGSGPTLVMIPGAGGTGGVFRMVTEHLAARYTVAIYDRRGFSRSQLAGPQDYRRRLATDADDVRRLITRIGDGPATVFGSSSGAIVALTVLTEHQSVVAAVVAHEPPAVRLLPGGQDWLDFWRSVYGLYQTEGIEPAMEAFRARTFPESDVRAMAHAPKNPANATYWFEHELRQYPAAELDLNTLQRYAGRIVPAAGRDSAGYPCHGVSAALAGKLDRAVVDLPGGHIGFVSAPAEFARELLDAIGPAGAPVRHASSGRRGRGRKDT